MLSWLRCPAPRVAKHCIYIHVVSTKIEIGFSFLNLVIFFKRAPSYFMMSCGLEVVFAPANETEHFSIATERILHKMVHYVPTQENIV